MIHQVGSYKLLAEGHEKVGCLSSSCTLVNTRKHGGGQGTSGESVQDQKTKTTHPFMFIFFFLFLGAEFLGRDSMCRVTCDLYGTVGWWVGFKVHWLVWQMGAINLGKHASWNYVCDGLMLLRYTSRKQCPGLLWRSERVFIPILASSHTILVTLLTSSTCVSPTIYMHDSETHRAEPADWTSSATVPVPRLDAQRWAEDSSERSNNFGLFH